MDAHPIPQDVTNFQFRLVGDMTLKQFSYLAVGTGLAYILFVFLSSSFPLIAWPLIVLSAGLGAAFAFLPIADRPLDHWLGAFIKAISSPTKRSWRVKNISTKDPAFTNRLNLYLQNIQAPAVSPLPKLPINAQVAPISQPLVTPSPMLQTQGAPSLVLRTGPSVAEEKNEDLKQLVETAKKAQIIQTQIVQTEHQLNELKQQYIQPAINQAMVDRQFKAVLGNLNNLNAQAQSIEAELGQLSSPPTPPSPLLPAIPTPTTPAPKKDFVTVVTIQPSKTLNLTLTNTPNIINGIVTDSQNNYLEGVIVVTHDKDGLPVRALRTNKLGQFIAATPLVNGVYTMTIEKDGLAFDTLKIELTGAILPPIKVSAKATNIPL